MSSLLSNDLLNFGIYEGGPYTHNDDKQEENGGRWYFSRKEIEENSPSRPDGIDLKKETYLRKSYCTFLQDLGMRLKVPQVTIATAIIFCHRFFLRQSHAKNDRRTVGTVCMFLAGKVEETPRPLKDVILVSYEINNKKDPEAIQRIKQKEVYEQQKELILLGERVVLATLGFDFNVHHPYKPLVEAIKKFKVAQNALAQVAWNFVNDGLRTSLCLQFKPHHIAAGAIFLAAKFLKVKLPSDGEKVWWQEFDVTPRQLEEVSNQMLELYEQNKAAPSQTGDVDGSASATTQKAIIRPSQSGDVNGNTSTQKAPIRPQSGDVDGYTTIQKATIRPSQTGDIDGSTTTQKATIRPQPGDEDNYTSSSNHRPGTSSRLPSDHSYSENHSVPSRPAKTRSSDHGNTETKLDIEVNESKQQHYVPADGHCSEEPKEKYKGQSPQDAIKKIDKDKVKAALEKRRKSRGGDVTQRTDFMDEDDLIERELEDGIELPSESDKNKQDKKHNRSKPSNQVDDDSEDVQYHSSTKGQSSRGQYFDHVEEGEVGLTDDGYDRSPKSSNRKRTVSGTSPDKRRRN